jgi:hypothetical protein
VKARDDQILLSPSDVTAYLACPHLTTLKLAHVLYQLVGHAAGTAAGEDLRERAVVPEDLVTVSVEALPDLLADLTVIAKDRAHVVELVCERDAQRRGRGFLEVCDVSLPALVPRGLRILEGVRALADDVSDTVAEALANVTGARFTMTLRRPARPAGEASFRSELLELDSVAWLEGRICNADRGDPVDAVAAELASVVHDEQEQIAVSCSS